MELLPAFTLCYPETAEEAARLLAGDPAARLLAGGTGFVVHLRLGLASPGLLIGLGRLPGFRGAACGEILESARDEARGDETDRASDAPDQEPDEQSPSRRHRPDS